MLRCYDAGIHDPQDAMYVVGHDHELVQLGVGETLRDLVPRLFY